MNSVSALIALKALDGLQTRSIVTAENIANAGTPGYRPMRVTFEDALRDAARQGPAAITQLAPRTELDGSGQALRLDLEMATAAGTAGRYGALIEVLSRQMQINALAVTGGR